MPASRAKRSRSGCGGAMIQSRSDDMLNGISAGIVASLQLSSSCGAVLVAGRRLSLPLECTESGAQSEWPDRERGSAGPAVFLTPWEMTLTQLDEEVGELESVAAFYE